MKKNISQNPSPAPVKPIAWGPALACLILLILGAWAFSGIKGHGFVWDDLEYIQNNPMLAQPLSKSIPHFFGLNYYVGNYHPLTMTVYALIYQKAKLDPALYHQVVLYFHLANILLVFWFSWLLAGRRLWIAFWVAAIFGLHPLRVESVAWVSELKDVLYAFFFLGALIAWVWRSRSSRPMLFTLISFLLFCLSLLSKPAAVSFPLAIMAIDYYQQGRFSRSDWLRYLPFFVLSFIMGLITIQAQDKAVGAVTHYNLMERIMLSSYAMIQYIKQLFLPGPLSALHPFPVKSGEGFPLIFKIAPFIAALVLAGVWYSRQYGRLLVFGFGFYLVNVALVLQFVTVGMAVMSERYSYIPHIGLLLALAIALDQYLLPKFKSGTAGYALLAGLFVPVIAFSLMTRERTKVWKNNKTLWTDVAEKYPETAVAYYNLGTYFMKEVQDDDSALAWYQKAIQKDPEHARALINLGLINGRKKNKDLALDYFARAEKKEPGFFELFRNRGYVHSMFGAYDEALADFSKYLELIPTDAQIYYGRALIYQMKKMNDRAYEDFSSAVRYDPYNGNYWVAKAQSAQSLGKTEEARADVQKGIRLGGKADPTLLKELGL